VSFHLRFWRTYKIATLNNSVSTIKLCFRLEKKCYGKFRMLNVDFVKQEMEEKKFLTDSQNSKLF